MLLRSLVAALASIALLTGCGGDEEVATDPGSEPQGVSCDYPEDPTGAAKEGVTPPPERFAQTGDLPATLSTSIGEVSLTLHADRAPCTVSSFLSLAAQGYFDQTTCHRLTMPASGIAVLQCGDPTGTGTGGPGYSFADELHGDESYVSGVVAMANAGPDTNGSQFFLVYGDSTFLDDQPNYTIFGTLDPASVETIATAAEQGTADGGPDGEPKVPVTITSVITPGGPTGSPTGSTGTDG